MLIKCLVDAIAFYAVAQILPGFKIKSFQVAIVCALVLSFVSWLLGWLFAALLIMSIPFLPFLAILVKLTGPLLIFAMFVGLFFLKTFLIIVTDKLIDEFEIDSVGTAFIGSFLMTVIGSFIRAFFHI